MYIIIIILHIFALLFYIFKGEPQFRKQLLEVFDLVEALWGEKDEEIEEGYDHQSYRRRRLSSWLLEVNRRTESEMYEESDEVCSMITRQSCHVKDCSHSRCSQNWDVMTLYVI